MQDPFPALTLSLLMRLSWLPNRLPKETHPLPKFRLPGLTCCDILHVNN